MMAIWISVAIGLFSRSLYGMAGFAALSAACYFPPLASYLAADVFGVLMLFTGAGGIYGLGRYSRITDWVFAT